MWWLSICRRIKGVIIRAMINDYHQAGQDHITIVIITIAITTIIVFIIIIMIA